MKFIFFSESFPVEWVEARTPLFVSQKSSQKVKFPRISFWWNWKNMKRISNINDRLFTQKKQIFFIKNIKTYNCFYLIWFSMTKNNVVLDIIVNNLQFCHVFVYNCSQVHNIIEEVRQVGLGTVSWLLGAKDLSTEQPDKFWRNVYNFSGKSCCLC